MVTSAFELCVICGGLLFMRNEHFSGRERLNLSRASSGDKINSLVCAAGQRVSGQLM